MGLCNSSRELRQLDFTDPIEISDRAKRWTPRRSTLLAWRVFGPPAGEVTIEASDIPASVWTDFAIGGIH